MSYNLEHHGDYPERRFYTRLNPLFPNYEVFWLQVIVPSTLRDSNGDIALCPGVDRDFELLVMSIYSVYFHSGVAMEFIEKAAHDYFLYEDFFFHLFAGVALVDRYLVYCSKLLRKTGSITKPMGIQDVLDVAWAQKLSNFHKLRKHTSIYRDAIAHDPRLGMLIMGERELLVPSVQRLVDDNDDRVTLTWSDVSKLAGGDFVSLPELAKNLAHDVISSVDDLLPEIIDLFKRLSSLESYQKLTCTGNYYPQKRKSSVLHPNVLQIRYASSSASGIFDSGVDVGDDLDERD